ncbi:TPM domain-containing protein [Terrarubrum flagellatum]|uniref:TPM domain-containing protein n=1 Tax=Terrirubrum flagellatum TaxID=2895980 RepID=UPI003144F185
MTPMSEEDRARIAKAIADAEQSTAAEIICVTMRSASDYWAAPILWATLAALLWPWPLIWITTLTAWTIYFTQLCVFAALAIALSFPRSRRAAMTPPWIRNRRARMSAKEHFFAQGLHRTVNRSGVLVFVAMAERYVEIMGDDSIALKISEAQWRPVAEALRDAVARNQLADGLVTAIGRCGQMLAEAAPPRENDRNELPDKVIVI